MLHSEEYRRPSVDDLRSALKSPAAIGVVAQEGADEPERLALFLQARPECGDIPVAALEEYCMCITHAASLERSLARFALPMCLDAWQQYLFDGRYRDLATEFSERLAGQASKVEASLGADTDHVRGFMRLSILSKLSTLTSIRLTTPRDMEVWVDYMAAYGAIWSDFDALIREWRSGSNLGFSIAAILYLSLLVYDDAEHPLFREWAGQRGGAVPLPWAGKDRPWLHDNIVALERVLIGTGAREWMSAAVDRIQGHADHQLACLILDDMDLQPYRIESRCRDLLTHLATPGSQKYWSDVYGIQR